MVSAKEKRIFPHWTAISQVDTKNKPRRRIAQHYAALAIPGGIRTLSEMSDGYRNEIFKSIFQVTRLHIPDTLFKYYSLTDDQDSNARKIQTLQDQQVFNGLCKDMNDPYDGKAYFYRHEAIQKFIRNPEALSTPITVR